MIAETSSLRLRGVGAFEAVPVLAPLASKGTRPDLKRGRELLLESEAEDNEDPEQ